MGDSYPIIKSHVMFPIQAVCFSIRNGRRLLVSVDGSFLSFLIGSLLQSESP